MRIETMPKDYEELIRAIHERYEDMNKSYQRIAVYLTQNPNDVAVNSMNAIAATCGLHASSFVRFAQMLGGCRPQLLASKRASRRSKRS
jgi:DNA-binding MurR/RpiR family transcriptional regulator